MWLALCCSMGEAVDVNLGAQPFVFDLDQLVAADRAAQGRAVEGCVPPRLPAPSPKH